MRPEQKQLDELIKRIVDAVRALAWVQSILS